MGHWLGIYQLVWSPQGMKKLSPPRRLLLAKTRAEVL